MEQPFKGTENKQINLKKLCINYEFMHSMWLVSKIEIKTMISFCN